LKEIAFFGLNHYKKDVFDNLEKISDSEIIDQYLGN